MNYPRKNRKNNCCDRIMTQINISNCNISNMTMNMMEVGEEGPPTVKLYRITVTTPDMSKFFNIRIDRSGKEVQLVLAEEQSDTLWQVIGTLGNNQEVAIGTPGGAQIWTGIDEASSIGLRPLRMMGDRYQYFALTKLVGNKYFMKRTGAGPNELIKNIGTVGLPEEGKVILSDGALTIFQFTEITQ